MINEKGELSKMAVTELVNNDINLLQDAEMFIDSIYSLLKNNNELYSAILKVCDPMIFMERLNKMANNKLIF